VSFTARQFEHSELVRLAKDYIASLAAPGAPLRRARPAASRYPAPTPAGGRGAGGGGGGGDSAGSDGSKGAGDKAALLKERGNAAFAARDFAAAVRHYSMAVNIDPGNEV
jgi:hypothetical protein